MPYCQKMSILFTAKDQLQLSSVVINEKNEKKKETTTSIETEFNCIMVCLSSCQRRNNYKVASQVGPTTVSKQKLPIFKIENEK